LAERVAENYRLITVDLAFTEVANVAWKRVVFFNESKEIALKALRKGIDFIVGACEVIRAKELIEDAFEIAIADKITIYDSLFIAASERGKVPLLTTDGKLYEKVKSKRNAKLI
jgi:predicted nucleic acid-binding protein